MTTKSIRFALATAGVVAAVGAVAAAGAASKPAANPANNTSPGQYGVSQCGNGKWATYKNPDGSQKFKNQGQCVSFFVHASK